MYPKYIVRAFCPMKRFANEDKYNVRVTALPEHFINKLKIVCSLWLCIILICIFFIIKWYTSAQRNISQFVYSIRHNTQFH